MSRHLVKISLALGALLGLASAADATTINPTALPLASCAPGTANAIPNDNVSDQGAFNCAVALLPAGGGTIYVPAGIFRLTAPVSVTNKNVAFRGEGQRISQLVWNHAGDGLVFESTSGGVNYTLAVRSLSLIKSMAEGGAALYAKWAVPGWHGSHGIVTTTITDVHIGTERIDMEPWPSPSVYWWWGIRLQNSTTAKISLFNIQGSSASGGFAAIQIHGDGALAGKSIGTQIRNGTIIKYVRGIETKDQAEGLHVQEVTIRESTYGIQMTDGTGTAIANNYISARTAGVELTNTANVSITNNTIDQFEDQVFRGINLVTSNSNRIIGNSVYSPGTGGQPRNGIVLDGAMAHAIVEGNTTINMNNGIWLTSVNVIFCNIIGNMNRNAGTPVNDLGGATHNVHNH